MLTEHLYEQTAGVCHGTAAHIYRDKRELRLDNCSGRCDVSVGYCKCCAARPTVVNGVGAYCSRGFRRMRQRDNPAAHFALSY